MASFYLKYKNHLLIVLTLLLAGVHIGLQLSHQVNIPRNYDDSFICLEDYTHQLDGDISLGEYLMSRKNNHRTFVQRLLVHVTYQLTGEVNFRTLLFLANAGFLIFVFWFIWIHRKHKLVLLLPVILLAPMAEYITWYSAVADYSYSFIFFYIIAWGLQRHSTKVGLVGLLILLPILTCTFGNSIVGLAILICWAIYLMIIKQLSKLHGGIFIFTSILCIVLYFTDYHHVGFSNYNLFQIGPYALTFSGSLLKYLLIPGTLHITGFVGLCLIALGILFYKYPKDVENSLWMMGILFVLGSGLAAGSARCTSDFCQPLAIRYELFGTVFFVFIVLLFDKYFNRWRYVIIALILFLTVTKYKQNLTKLDSNRYDAELIGTQAHFTNFFFIKGRKKWRAKNNAALQSAKSRGIYNHTVNPLQFIPAQHLVSCDQLTSISVKLIQVRHKDDFTFIRGQTAQFNSKRYYLKSDDSCRPITLNFDPTTGRKHLFFTVIPMTNKKDVEIMSESIQD